MPRPHLFLRRPRLPLWSYFLCGSILGIATLITLEVVRPWDSITNDHSRTNEYTPTAAQHAEATAAGWIPGTDGFYRAIYGPDAY